MKEYIKKLCFKLWVVPDWCRNHPAKTMAIIALVSALAAIIAAFAACVSVGQTKESLRLMEKSLELDSLPVITIKNDNIKMDSVLEKAGFVKTEDSIAYLSLVNSSLGKIVDVDIRMVLLEMSVDDKSMHPKVCFLGYINHVGNPKFFVENLLEDNVNNKNIALDSLEKYNLSINYSSFLEKLKNEKKGNYFIKIDINYKRGVDGKSFYYSKIYHILNSEYIIDTDIKKDSIGLNDQKNEIVELLGVSTSTYPFIMYPFKEQEFIDVIKSNIRAPYTGTYSSSNCEYFEMNKKINVLD